MYSFKRLLILVNIVNQFVLLSLNNKKHKIIVHVVHRTDPSYSCIEAVAYLRL